MGGRIFLQLWHVGRQSHTDLQPNGEPPVAPSAIAAEGYAYTRQGEVPFSMPRARAGRDSGDYRPNHDRPSDCGSA
jgi:N-ethylmaleimide reductase